MNKVWCFISLWYISCPVFSSVVRGLDWPHAGFPMFVAQSISHCIGFYSGAEERSKVCVGLEICNREEQETSHNKHTLSKSFIRFSPTRSPLQEEDEVGNIISHLWCWSGSSIFKVNQTVMELSGHTDNHVIKVTWLKDKYGLKCFPFGTYIPYGGLKW